VGADGTEWFLEGEVSSLVKSMVEYTCDDDSSLERTRRCINTKMKVSYVEEIARYKTVDTFAGKSRSESSYKGVKRIA
jgi:hypothetical protein